jgi:small ligand-binding sensory domain FIST
MKAGGALVLTADAREAASRAAGEARASLGGLSPTFAVLFASGHFFGSAQDLVTAVSLPHLPCLQHGVVHQPPPSLRTVRPSKAERVYSNLNK